MTEGTWTKAFAWWPVRTGPYTVKAKCTCCYKDVYQWAWLRLVEWTKNDRAGHHLPAWAMKVSDYTYRFPGTTVSEAASESWE